MSLALLLALLALGASVFLAFQPVDRALPIIALVVSGVQVLMRLGVLRLDLRGVPLGLVLGGALAAVGLVLFFRVSAKMAVAATTCVLLVGTVQLLGALRLAS